MRLKALNFCGHAANRDGQLDKDQCPTCVKFTDRRTFDRPATTNATPTEQAWDDYDEHDFNADCPDDE